MGVSIICQIVSFLYYTVSPEEKPLQILPLSVSNTYQESSMLSDI